MLWSTPDVQCHVCTFLQSDQDRCTFIVDAVSILLYYYLDLLY